MAMPSGQESQRAEEESAADGHRLVGGRYQLLTKIGEGGMSVVYLALDKVLNKEWAAKEIRHVDDPVQRELVVKGIVTEANMIKRFDHPAIPRIVDIIDDAGTLYVILDYVEGRTLAEILEKGGPQAEDAVANWAIQLCDVLQYLHRLDPPVIYRDMKPSNVMLKSNGLVELIDFGISGELAGADAHPGEQDDAVRLGTRGFAPPEQYEGGRGADSRSDVYALGATMYCLLTGKSPGDYAEATPPLRQVRPELSEGMEKVVAKAMQADPDDRYPDCAEMAYAIEHRGERERQERAKMLRTWRGFIGLAAASLASLVLGVSATIGRIVVTDGDYNHWMQVGEQSASVSEATAAYRRAAQVKPGEVGPYLGMVSRYQEDQTFSRVEEEEFRSTILPNLEQVSSSGRYAELAFAVGKLYWYEYGVDAAEVADPGRETQIAGRSARIRAAAQWMDAAARDQSFAEHDAAQVYSSIASFNTGIVPSINEGSDLGSYAPYFQTLRDLVSFVSDESNDVMRLDVANLTLDALSTYPRKFRADGVSKQDILDLAHDAATLARESGSTTSLLDHERARALGTADEMGPIVEDAFIDARMVRQ